MKDPIVEEVRAARQKISEECEHDMHKLFERQRAAFAEWKGKKITVPFHPEWHAPIQPVAIVAEERTGYGRRADDRGN